MAISDERLRHMLGVARYMYKSAKDYGMAEKDARRMFILGLLHDVGYEWENGKDHAAAGFEVLGEAAYIDAVAVLDHGSTSPIYDTYMLRLLNDADMHVSSTGNEVTVQERLDDIGRRYGFDSTQYKDALYVSKHFLPGCEEGE